MKVTIPTPSFEQLYREARQVAIRVHGTSQPYDIFPYEKHLDDVVDVLKAFGLSGDYIIAGYLHDGMEDGPLSYNDIRKAFGIEAAEMVYCVTDELGRNRKEKKEKTLPKTKSNPKAIKIKLADRIANVRHSLRMAVTGGLSVDSDKMKMYKKEYPEFRSELFDSAADDVTMAMWAMLDEIMEFKSQLV